MEEKEERIKELERKMEIIRKIYKAENVKKEHLHKLKIILSILLFVSSGSYMLLH